MNALWKSAWVPAAALIIATAPVEAQLNVGGVDYNPSTDSASTDQNTDSGQQAVDLAEAQRNLTDLGYPTGAIDGTENTDTAIAIAQFQSANELEVTGKLSPELAELLEEKVQAMRSGTVVEEGEVSSASMAGSASEQADSNCLSDAADTTRDASRLASAGAGLLNRLGASGVARGISNAASTANAAARVASATDAVTECEPE